MKICGDMSKTHTIMMLQKKRCAKIYLVDFEGMDSLKCDFLDFDLPKVRVEWDIICGYMGTQK